MTVNDSQNIFFRTLRVFSVAVQPPYDMPPDKTGPPSVQGTGGRLL